MPYPCYRWELDPSVERGTSCQVRIMCASRINRVGEGLRRCEVSHRMSQRAIGDDGWLASHCWWPIDPLEVGQPSPTRQSSPAA
jgi:hypothetical protein